jgi:hypothetical protein
MARRDRLVCECGGEIGRPLPLHCPHCGARLVGVRRRWSSILVPILAIGGMFAALVAFVWWWANR